LAGLFFLYKLYLAGSYEENELIKAGALINTGKIDECLAFRGNIFNIYAAGVSMNYQKAVEEIMQ
jgi:starch-binding outer membrane protein, SusD/RagB family